MSQEHGTGAEGVGEIQGSEQANHCMSPPDPDVSVYAESTTQKKFCFV